MAAVPHDFGNRLIEGISIDFSVFLLVKITRLKISEGRDSCQNCSVDPESPHVVL